MKNTTFLLFTLLLAGLTAATTLCYQESANVSTACGGLSSGLYVSDGAWTSYLYQVYDGDYSTFGSGTAGYSGILYINYTIPAKAAGLPGNQTWQVDAMTASTPANVTFPSACVGAAGTPLQTKINSSNNVGGLYKTEWACYNGAAWQIIKTDSGANGQKVYEEGIYWTLDTSAPTWSNNVSSISLINGTTAYVNITWADNIDISAVQFESNYSGAATNYSMTHIGSGVYTYNFTLPSGNFYWKSWANDTAGNLNVSDTYLFQAYPECFQESANVSTACGGLGTGTYASSGSWFGSSYLLALDGDWATFEIGAEGSTGTLSINYTIPSQASNASLWKVKDYDATINLSISGCWGAGSPLQLRINSTNNVGGVNSTRWFCWDGAAWLSLRNDSGAQYHKRIYEEGIYWSMPAATSPSWTANSSSIPATYSPSTPSQFNITWTDNNSISMAFFESNYSGAATNYSMNNITASIYNYSAILPAGTFYWKSSANNTLAMINTSDSWAFTIGKATTSPTISINGSTSGYSHNIPFTANLSCSDAISGNHTIYENGTALNSTNGASVWYMRTYDTDGFFNITCSLLDHQNYTGSTESNVTASTGPLVYFDSPTPAQGSDTADIPVQLKMVSEDPATSCLFDINGANQSSTLSPDGLNCTYDIAPSVHATLYSVRGWMNVSGTMYSTNESNRSFSWVNETLCPAFVTVFNITQNTSSYITLNDTLLYVVAENLTVNNTCNVSLTGVEFDISDGAADSTWTAYPVSMAALELKNFSSFPFRIPIAGFDDGENGGYPFFSKTNNHEYHFNTTYTRNITQMRVNLSILGDYRDLYKCESTDCSFIAAHWSGPLSISVIGTRILRTGDVLAASNGSMLAYTISYQLEAPPAEGGGSSGGGSDTIIIQQNVTIEDETPPTFEEKAPQVTSFLDNAVGFFKKKLSIPFLNVSITLALVFAVLLVIALLVRHYATEAPADGIDVVVLICVIAMVLQFRDFIFVVI